MPIIEDLKLIFQHVPKTGGLAVLDAFNTPGSGHQHLNYYFNICREKGYMGWTLFTIIRDPVERFISALSMYLDPPEEQTENGSIARSRARFPEIFEEDDINDGLTFENVQNLFQDGESFHFWPAASMFIHNPHLEPGTHIVNSSLRGRYNISYPSLCLTYENLQEDFSYFCELLKLDIDPTLKQVNTSKLKPVLTQKTRKLIEQMYQIDYMIFGKIYEESYVRRFKQNS